ncbi:MAG: GNAT family N-acetyltransferase [Clostridia bacterium]|nr:GNAT family N-acetyltransferase [Clostridia bacterium]
MICAYKEKDYKDVVALWQEAFGDTEEDIAACMRHFAPYLTLYTEGDALLGMFMRMPLYAGDQKGEYIYAVATAKAAQGCGIATKLLDVAKADVDSGKIDFLALVPAKPSLFDFYEKRSFIKGSLVTKINYAKQGREKSGISLKRITAQEMYIKRSAYFQTLAAWDTQMLSAIDEIYGGCFYALEDKGFCLAYPTADKVIVSELCVNGIEKEAALEALCAYFGKDKIEAVLPDANGEAFAMFYPAEAAKLYFNIAIN